MPTFTDTAIALWKLMASGTLWSPLLESNLALSIGFPIAAVVGAAFGVLFGRVSIVDRLGGLYLDAALVVPIIAIIPIIIVALGISLPAKVAVVVLFSLPVIAIAIRSAVQEINFDRVEMARSFGARRLQTWTKVVLPAAFPAVFAGLRIGLSRAISGMVVIELTLVPTGVGGLFVEYRSRFDAPDLFAVTLIVLFEGISLVWIMRRVEGLLPGAMHHGD